MTSSKALPQRRHKSFEATHQEIIETAVRLISEQGVGSLSISAVARALGIDRTTVYYHFDGREALLAAVKVWSSAELAKAFNQPDVTQQERIDYTTRYVLENPELTKLWMDDFLAGVDIRKSYPFWDEFVAVVRDSGAYEGRDPVDAEVYCINMLTSAVFGAWAFRNSICPTASTETIVRRFGDERRRVLRLSSLLRD
ncbi:helix-turn-helix domain containing protein [Phenylobacterium sp. LjRoot225]|uniref:TetR/AcrR family transcriptional regulator n=1 Tax=Phenylobacterium sp. LjRoot225 TaxID=3342285 RepID=UPI003ECC6AC3